MTKWKEKENTLSPLVQNTLGPSKMEHLREKAPFTSKMVTTYKGANIFSDQIKCDYLNTDIFFTANNIKHRFYILCCMEKWDSSRRYRIWRKIQIQRLF